MLLSSRSGLFFSYASLTIFKRFDFDAVKQQRFQLDTRINPALMLCILLHWAFGALKSLFSAADRCDRAVFCFKSAFWTDSSHGGAAFMEDQAVHVAGEVGQGQFGFGALEADGPDEKAETVLLMGEDMLDAGADG